MNIGTHSLHYIGLMIYAYPPNVRKFEIISKLFSELYRLVPARAILESAGISL